MSEEIRLEILGREFLYSQFSRQPCACGRPAECPGFSLDSLEHCCWDVSNAAGNPHLDKATDLWWVEWHFEFCYDKENHISEWLADGRAMMDEYRKFLLSLTPQERAQGNRREHRKKHSTFIQVLASELRMLRADAVEWYAKRQGLSCEEAAEIIIDHLAWIIALRVFARSEVSLNHEVSERYYSNQLLRFTRGQEHTLFSLVNGTEPSHVLRLRRNGEIVELQTGSLPALKAFAEEGERWKKLATTQTPLLR